MDDTAASYIHSPIFPSPSPFVDRRRLTMRFFTAREGCGGLGVVPEPGPDRVAMSLALVFDMDDARRPRAGGDPGGDEAVPKSELVKVTPGELGERAWPLPPSPPPPLPLLAAGVELSGRYCS